MKNIKENKTNLENNQNVNKRKISIYEIILIVVAFIIYAIINPRLCIIKKITGLPCPACGMTRAFFYFFTFDLEKAFYYHPLFPLVIVGFFLIVSQKLNKKLQDSKVINIIYLIMGIIFIIVYIIRMILYFPDVVPMDYDYNSLIGLVIKLFK